MKSLAIITTHPIQYNAPWFKLLASRGHCKIKVFYSWSQTKESVKDLMFGKEIKWDIPLLQGYDYEFVENVSKNPGSNHFFGIDCPTLIGDIKKFEPDAVLFFGWNFKSHLLAIHYFKGKIPVWFRGDSTLIDEVSGYRTQLRRFVLKIVYLHVNKALYVGKANKEYFLKHGLSLSQLLYVPHAIDNSRFADDSNKKHELEASQWRTKLGYKKDDIVVVFAGKFESKKQPGFLLDAIITANKLRKKPLHLLLIGNGPLELELKNVAKNEHYVQFLPFQNQTIMPVVYRLGNIFCLPSKGPGETWGLAVNEAMACGKPIIVSSKVGCSVDLVRPNINGYIFNASKIQELILILKDLSLNDIQLLGKQACQDVQNYNFEAIVSSIETELSNL